MRSPGYWRMGFVVEINLQRGAHAHEHSLRPRPLLDRTELNKMQDPPPQLCARAVPSLSWGSLSRAGCFGDVSRRDRAAK